MELTKSYVVGSGLPYLLVREVRASKFSASIVIEAIIKNFVALDYNGRQDFLANGEKVSKEGPGGPPVQAYIEEEYRELLKGTNISKTIKAGVRIYLSKDEEGRKEFVEKGLAQLSKNKGE